MSNVCKMRMVMRTLTLIQMITLFLRLTLNLTLILPIAPRENLRQYFFAFYTFDIRKHTHFTVFRCFFMLISKSRSWTQNSKVRSEFRMDLKSKSPVYFWRAKVLSLAYINIFCQFWIARRWHSNSSDVPEPDGDVITDNCLSKCGGCSGDIMTAATMVSKYEEAQWSIQGFFWEMKVPGVGG